MFRNLGLFSCIPCPSASRCTVKPCPFSHSANLPSPSSSADVSPIPATPYHHSIPESSNPDPNSRPVKKRIVEEKGDSKAGVEAPNIQLIYSPPSSPAKISITKLSSEPQPISSTPATRRDPNAFASKVGRSLRRDEGFTGTFLALSKPVTTVAKSLAPIQDRTLPPISPSVRSTMLTLFHKEYLRLYSALPKHFAHRDAIEEEYFLAKTSHKLTYSDRAKSIIMALKRRPKATAEPETGTLDQIAQRLKAVTEHNKATLPLKVEEVAPFVHTTKTLTAWGFLLDIPIPSPHTPGFLCCARCNRKFTSETRCQHACITHWGKLPGRISDPSRKWTCCDASPGSKGCTTNPSHVRLFVNPGELAFVRGFTELEPHAKGMERLVALDCEMVFTEDGIELGRLSVLNAKGDVLMDYFIETKEPVWDYNTRFSGLSPEILAGKATVTFDEALSEFKKYVSRDTIIIGHGLENDFNAMRIIHRAVLDTSILFPRDSVTVGRRWALRDLVKKELGRIIQEGEKDFEYGHDSVEDAKGCLDLVKKRVRKETGTPG